MSYPGGSALPPASISVQRENRDVAWAFIVWIDGAPVGKLRPRSKAVFPVSPGVHRIQVRDSRMNDLYGLNKSDTLEFMAGPGERVDFQCTKPRFGWFKTAIVLTRAGASPQRFGSQNSDARVLATRATTRFEEPLGEQVRQIDNRHSPATVTRTIRASREWTRTLTVGTSLSRTSHGELGANLVWLSAKASIEAELQRSVSFEIGSTQVFEEAIEVVPPQTEVLVVLGWKHIWQCGEAQVLLPDGSVHVIPYQVIESLTFDQRTEPVI